MKDIRLRSGLLVLACFMLEGCAHGVPDRIQNADLIAKNGGLGRQDIEAAPFILASWRKIRAPHEVAHIYIEGDGFAWLSRSTPSNNPTPKTPLAFSLASVDLAHNVIYLARPCQFTDFSLPNNACRREYWMGKRYAAEVVESYHSALNQITAETGLAQFHLIGFSGGANIAGLLAATRGDVLSLRTVAGNVDNDAFTRHHKVSAMPYSLNMADHADTLSSMPQRHFIASEDRFVPSSLSQGYLSKLKDQSCAQATVVEGTTHLKGWARKWNALLGQTPSCH